MKKQNLKNIVCIAVIAFLLTISGVVAVSDQTAVSSSGDLTQNSENSKCSVPTKMVLVRHGQTSWNALGLLQGNADVPLDATGVAQAQALAENTSRKIVNVVYSSPLSRAYDTAQAIADAHQLL